ncbi:transposase [Flavobacterium sp. 3-218]
MSLFKDKFKTNSHRLQSWDYSSEAVYFITIVTKDRNCIFGTIEDEKMILNENGKIVEIELLKSINIRKNWFFHNWVIMPNHIHLLVEIQDKENQDKNIHETYTVETHRSASTSSISTTDNVTDNSLSTYGREMHCGAPLQNHSDLKLCTDTNSDSNILPETYTVETHRSASTPSISTTDNKSESNFSRKSNSISSFVAIFKSITTKQINGFESIWQANYHDHIVRNYKTFEKIYDYIKHNPRSWEADSLK